MNEDDAYDAVARRIDTELQFLDPEFAGITYDEMGADYHSSLRVVIETVVGVINEDPEIRRGLGVIDG